MRLRSGKKTLVKDFKQLCIWPAFYHYTTKFNSNSNLKFYIENKFNIEIKIADFVTSLFGTDDLFFYISKKDRYSKFRIKRLMYNIRWWKDVVKFSSDLYTPSILKKYSI